MTKKVLIEKGKKTRKKMSGERLTMLMYKLWEEWWVGLYLAMEATPIHTKNLHAMHDDWSTPMNIYVIDTEILYSVIKRATQSNC